MRAVKTRLSLASQRRVAHGRSLAQHAQKHSFLYLYKAKCRCDLFQAAGGHMGSYEQGVFCKGGFDEGTPASEIAFGIGPGGHPGGLFDFAGVMVEVTEAVEGLSFCVNPDYLVAGGFTRSGNDVDCGDKLKVSFDQFEQTMLVKRSEGVAVGGSGVLEVLLGIRVFPVGAAQVAAGVGEAGDIFAITFGCDASIMVEVGMGDDEVRYVLRAHCLAGARLSP